MPNKQLTAKVRLNTKDAEKSIDRLIKKLDKLNNVTNKAANAGNQNKYYANTQRQVDNITNRVKAWANAQKQVTTNVKSTGNALSSIGSKLKWLASTYLGVMGAKAVTSATDTLVGAQNRLNYVDPGQFDDASGKMYATAQGARTSYQDMMSNVSKNMVLAGDAFDNNIDYAIRFQEVMAKAYAVGGASAAEMSSSMYQLTQALGSGVLQGDELRSVREGAPLAYKAIEEFAQGIYGADKNLKDLASDGWITSEMVVAAVMDMGAGIDEAFANTRQTFGQTFDQIKNSALYAFQPVMEMLTDALNKAIDNGMIQKFETFFTNVSKIILIAFRAIEIGVNWIADNWDWLQYIVYGVVIAMLTYLGLLAATAVKTAVTSFLAFLINNPFILWIVGIALLVAALVWLLDQCSTFCDFIVLLAVGLARAILVVLTVVLVAYLATGTLMLSIPTLIALVVIGVIALLLAAFIQFTGEIIGGAFGIWEVFKNVCSGIGQIFSDLWYSAESEFWYFIADMVDGLNWLAKPLSAIAELFGKEFSVDSFTADLRAYGDNAKSKISDGNYFDISGAWRTGYDKGYAIGEGIQNRINEFGEKVKEFTKNPFEDEDGKDKTSILDEIANKLGLDFSGMGNFPTNGVGSAYTPDMEKLLGGIGDDTGKIADSMDLTSEDLEYLRRVADMEWKKEFTTAEIKIDMTNNNQVNGESDLDGIVTKLADKLYEEMNVLANGVYA